MPEQIGALVGGAVWLKQVEVGMPEGSVGSVVSAASRAAPMCRTDVSQRRGVPRHADSQPSWRDVSGAVRRWSRLPVASPVDVDIASGTASSTVPAAAGRSQRVFVAVAPAVGSAVDPLQ